MSGNMAMVNWV